MVRNTNSVTENKPIRAVGIEIFLSLPRITLNKLTTIGIIGSGNVAWHLTRGLNNASGIKIAWVYSRNETTRNELTQFFNVPATDTLLPVPTDLVLVCVSDDAIQSILDILPEKTKVAYTSGTVSLEKLNVKQENCGVFYPLQSFTKKEIVSLENVPFLIEATTPEYTHELEQLALKLSNNVRQMNSEQRKQLHIAAVFSNNFVNHLLLLAQEHLNSKSIPAELLQPLITETIRKATDLGPFHAQSGPARRFDEQTIQTHLSELNGLPKEIYSLITESIKKTYST